MKTAHKIKLLTKEDSNIVQLLENSIEDYGICYDFVQDTDSCGLTKNYIVLGLTSINPEYFDPREELAKQNRNPDLFYCPHFIYEYSPDRPFREALTAVLRYASRAELISTLFKENGVFEAPEFLRIAEISHLDVNNRCSQDNTIDELARMKAIVAIRHYFKKAIKTKNPIRKAFNRFYRSDYYNDDKSKLHNNLKFLFGKKSQTMSLKELIRTSDDTMSIEMEEFEYKEFKEMMKKYHPDIKYNVGKKVVINNGIKKDIKEADIHNLPPKCGVTYEQYIKLLSETINSAQFDVVNNHMPIYYEKRKVTFRNVDEAIVAGVYDKIAFKCTHPNDLAQITYSDKPYCYMVNTCDYIDFSAYAKANNMPFFIDYYGNFAPISTKQIPIVVKYSDRWKYEGIRDAMIDSKFKNDRCVTQEQKRDCPSLDDRIKKVREEYQKTIVHNIYHTDQQTER